MRATDCPILYVDDESPNIVVFESTFGEEFEIVCASSGEQALELLDRLPIAVLLADQRMPGMTGIDLCEHVREWHPGVVRILVTAYSDQRTAIDAINRGGLHRYLTKPWDVWEVRQILAEAVTRVQLERTVTALRATIAERNRMVTLGFIRARILYDLANVTTTLLMTSSNLEHDLKAATTHLPPLLRESVEQEMGELQRALGYLVELHDKTRTILTRPVPGQHAVPGIVRDAIELIRPEVGRVARFRVSVPDDLVVWVDRTDLIRIFLNLLQNARRAIESTGAEGEIYLEATQDGTVVRIVVADSGIGIPPDQHERVFRPETSLRARSLGTGLGLPICRELARANRGDITILPTGPLAGAAFCLTFPCTSPEVIDG
ncbi:MAG: hybrid sensor histidine kinase/response regulator [Pseudomonadota bacterium]|nr:hybrid sensor histidine kinase/response regulator [Pseudomonadota bacterium]